MALNPLNRVRSVAREERLQRWALRVGPRCAVRYTTTTSESLSDGDCTESDSMERTDNENGKARLERAGASSGSLERLARWSDYALGARNGYRGQPPTIERCAAWERSSRGSDVWRGLQGRRALSVRVNKLANDVHETRLIIGDDASATLTETLRENGSVTESLAVVSQLRGGKQEVVYRRMTFGNDGPSECMMTESGRPTAMIELVERTAARSGTTRAVLLQAICDHESAGSILEQSVPSGFSRSYSGCA